MKLPREAKRGERIKNGNSQDSMHTIWASVGPQKEKRKKRAERLFKDIIAGNLPNLGGDTPAPRSKDITPQSETIFSKTCYNKTV